MDYQMISRCVYEIITQPGDSLRTVTGRFLQMINVDSSSFDYPDYFYNVIAIKMLWEYRKKFGTLEIEIGKPGTLSLQEVMLPIPAANKLDFHQFCLAQALH